MKNLIYKEFSIGFHKFWFIMAVMLGCLFFIPRWIFMIVFLYFFWIALPQIILGYNATGDYMFNSMLPVSKKDTVRAKILSIILLQLFYFAVAVVFGIIHNLLYGSFTWFLHVNPLLYGVALATYAIFNIVFFPTYFKTAYKYGKPLIVGVIVSGVFALAFEFLALRVPEAAQFLNSEDMLIQLGALFLGILLFVGLNWITINQSVKNYLNIR